MADRPRRGLRVVAFFGGVSLIAASLGGGAVAATPEHFAPRSSNAKPPDRRAMMFVTGNAGQLVAIDTSTDAHRIEVVVPRSAGEQIAMTRDGHTAWMLTAPNSISSVTPIHLVARTVGKPIPVGRDGSDLAVSPDGATVYVVSFVTTGLVTGAGSVTPIDVKTRTPGPPIPVGREPDAVAVTPDGRTVYVASPRDGTVTPIDAATRTAGPPIRVAGRPEDIAIAPDGATAYVTGSINWGEAGRVTPIDTATNKAGTPIAVGLGPVGIAITPNGKTAYAADGRSVWPIDLATRKVGRAIDVGSFSRRIAITPDGATAYVAGTSPTLVTPIDLASGTPGAPGSWPASTLGAS